MVTPFSWDLPYPSQRAPVLARACVATSQPLAAQAGLDALRRGGNAVDAAIAAAMALTVVEPTSNGIGADAFALVWDGTALHGLNASGRSPAAWTPERFAGRETLPPQGWDSVTVPGAVSAWAALSAKFGTLPFERLADAAIAYAADGYPVGPVTADIWARCPAVYAAFPDWMRTFAPEGRGPAPGERVRLPDHAASLRAIAASRGEDFYRGDLARRIAEASRAGGGALTAEDLAAHTADWVEPIAQDFAGATVHEIPPNGQGIAALLALAILGELPLRGLDPDCPDALHLQAEAMKLAFGELYREVGDPAAMAIAPRDLLAPARVRALAARVDRQRAGPPPPGVPKRGGTVYLCAADAQGMMVSFIQSNYFGFGSGIVVPGTGIALQNRGYGFVLDAGHPNRVGPRKRPFHTIIPGFVTAGGRARAAFGVMGGAMQAQGHVQVMCRLLVHGQNPQAAIDAPRWRVGEAGELHLEAGVPAATRDELARRGHRAQVSPAAGFGGGQMIHVLDDGFCAASDWRKEGQAVGF